jgi:gluconolactonase
MLSGLARSRPALDRPAARAYAAGDLPLQDNFEGSTSMKTFLLAALAVCAQTRSDGAAPAIPPDARLEKLWSEGSFTEGGALAGDGSILFSDIGTRIMRFDPRTRSVSVFRDPSGRANGLVFDPRGRLVAAEGANSGGKRRISITEADSTVRTLADRFEGKRFNSPNDVAVDQQGTVYFSDPRYVGDDPRELDFEAVFRVDPDGTVTRLETTATKPNGLAVSPDGKILYVSDNGPKRRALLALPLDANHNVGRPKVLKDFGDGRGIDGMTVTNDGKIVAAAGAGILGGVYIYEPDGTPVGFVATPELPTNVEFGGDDGKTLYITAGKSLYRIQTNLKGYHVWPPGN